MDDPDEDLVRRIGANDRDAIEVFVRAKLPRMTAVAFRLLGDAAEAEDVAQEVFVRVWRHAARWEPGRARFDTWMHRVALNLCTDRLRRRRDLPLPEDYDAADEAPSALDRLLGDDKARTVERALGLLPPRQREAIVLTYYQELSNQDAAAAMEVGVEAIESLLSRARRTLRSLLAPENTQGPQDGH